MLAVRKGDLDGDAATGLADAIFALQVISGMRRASGCVECFSSDMDVNGDNLIGLAEAIYAFQVLVSVSP